MKASDLFVKQLEEEGVEYIFGLPGEENLDFLESLRNSKIKLIVTRHEQSAAFMAATYGRLTGKAGVCFSTLGPGATNLVTGVAHAQLVGAPLISISGQKAIRQNWQARFQIIDIVSLMKPITKKSKTIVDPSTIPTILRGAFKVAESERPGAVHIELPEDVASSETEAVIQKRSEIRRPSPDHRAIDEATKLIQDAKNPIIIISGGAARKPVTNRLLEFIDKSGIYVAHTQMAKGVIPADNDRSLFTTGIHKQDYINCGIDRADLIITIGYNIVEYPPYVWNKNLDKKILNIDFTSAEPDKYYNPDLEIIGDISHSLQGITGKIKKKRNFPLFKKTRDLIEKKIDNNYEKKYPLLPQDIIHSVRDVMAKDDIITLDNGIYKLWFSRFYNAYKRNTVILDNALATMGAGLPSGITAKLLNPEKKVLAVVGDGGFMMNSQEIETALRAKVPLVVLILNDFGYGFIKWKQQNMKFKNFGLDICNPNFVKYAESYGAKGLKVNKGEDLRDVLKKAFSLNTVVIVECPVDYSINYEVFSKELSNLVCEI